MNYKVVFVLILLMFVFLLGVFLVKCGNLLIVVKKELINQLEERHHVELNVKDARFWPINQLILKEVVITSSDDEFFFSAPVINLYYNFMDLVIYRKEPLECINHLKLEEPFLRTKTMDFTRKFDYEWLSRASSLQVEVVRGDFYLSEEGKKVGFDNISLLMSYLNEDEFKLLFNTDMQLDELKLKNYLIQDLEVGQVELGMDYAHGEWQGSLQTDLFALEDLFNSLPDIDPGFLKDIKGIGELALNFSGNGQKLDQYNGSFILQEGRGVLTGNDYVESGEFNNIQGEFVFTSAEQWLFIKDLQFMFADNPYNFKGSLRFRKGELPIISGQLGSDSLDLANSGLKIRDSGLSGLASLDLTLSGEITNPDLNLNLNLARGRLNQEQISDLEASLRYRNDFIYLDSLEFTLNQDSPVFLKGLYNTDLKEYSFLIEGSDFQLALLQDYLDYDLIKELKGKASTILTLTGKGFNLADLNLSGYLDITKPEVSGHQLEGLKTDLWLSGGKLLLHGEGTLDLESKLCFDGEINLNRQNLALQVSGQGIELDILKELTDRELPRFSGRGDFTGSLSGNWQDPLLELALTMNNGMLMDYSFSDLVARVNYQHNHLQVEKLTATSLDSQLTGSGRIEIDDPYPDIEAKLSIRDLDFNLINNQLDWKLPLNGGLIADLIIRGSIHEPQIEGSITSDDLIVKVKERGYPVDRVDIAFKWQEEETIVLESLQAILGQAILNIKGELSEERLNLSYVIENLKLEQLVPEEEINGLLALTGEIGGRFDKPEINGLITASEISYQGHLLDGFKGNFSFLEDSLRFEEIDWQINNNQYHITGIIDNITNNIRLDFHLETEKGKLTDLPPAVISSFPIPRDYYFSGSLDLKGSLNRPEIILDLVFQDQPDRLYLKGEIGNELNLSLKGKQVAVNKLPFLQETGFDLEGRLDFSGSLTGPVDAYNLELTTELLAGRINNYAINRIKGLIEIYSASRLYLDQEMVLSDVGSLNFSGYLPLSEEELELDLVMDLQDLPLSLLSTTFTDIPSLEGYIDGRLTVKGTGQNPCLDGRLLLTDGGINPGFTDNISGVSGELVFSDQIVKLESMSGKYGDGNIILGGQIKPFNQEELWNLSISGQDLPFDYGSFKGRIDSEIKMTRVKS